MKLNRYSYDKISKEIEFLLEKNKVDYRTNRDEGRITAKKNEQERDRTQSEKETCFRSLFVCWLVCCLELHAIGAIFIEKNNNNKLR